MAYNRHMRRSTVEGRAGLAERLLSPDAEVDLRARKTGRDEIRRRLQGIDSGRANLIPWREVQRRLRARLQR